MILKIGGTRDGGPLETLTRNTNTVTKNTSFAGFVSRCAGWLLPPTTVLQSIFLLALRLYWGWQFFQTGEGRRSMKCIKSRAGITHLSALFRSRDRIDHARERFV